MDNIEDIHEGSALAPDAYATARRGARRFMVYLGLVIAAFLAVFVIWASQAELDVITRGDGRIIPTGQNKIVQHLEGGIISAILVNEGQRVEEGQILLRIDSTTSRSEMGENRIQLYSLQAKASRLRAEAEGSETVEFPESVRENGAEFVERERELFERRQRQRESELEALQEQVRQRAQQLAEVRSSVRRLETRVGLLEQEVVQAREDFDSGALSQSDLVRKERELIESRGELETTRLSVRRHVDALEEARQNIVDKRNTFLAEVRQELVETEARLATLTPTLEADRDRVERTEIRSPVRGTVSQVSVSTIGAVVRPGQPLVEIVPLEESLLVEARIRPQDRAFLRPNQQATVKVTAYDFAIFGGLEGRVIDISADAIRDDRNRQDSFYRIRIRTNKNYLQRGNRRLPIIPGMTVSVDIQTGQKSVLDYIFEPVSRVIDESLRER